MANKNKKQILKKLFEKHIKGTSEGSIIFEEVVLLCHITKIVEDFLTSEGRLDSNVYIGTRVLKHLYDKRPAEEFDFILKNLHKIVMYPDDIYTNKGNKRGSYCFVKNMKESQYLCPIEMDENKKELFVVTAFRIRKDNYLKDYKLLWSWRSDSPSS